MLRRSALIVLILVLAACSSSTPPPSGPSVAPTAAAPTAMPPAATTPAPTAAAAAPGDKATIYIYRQKAFMGMALRPTVMVDGKDLVNMGNGRLYVGYFTPGS